MLPEQWTAGWRFWAIWFVAFVGFPIGGLLANLIVGPASTPLRAVLAGAVTGVVLGAVQWVALQGRIPVSALWIVATAIGLAVGLGIGVAVAGSENGDSAFLWRAIVAGICVGVAQAFLLRGLTPQPIFWAAVVFVGWLAGWYVTRAIGVDLEPKWTVFGAAGAVTFQIIVGLALAFLIRVPAVR